MTGRAKAARKDPTTMTLELIALAIYFSTVWFGAMWSWDAPKED